MDGLVQDALFGKYPCPDGKCDDRYAARSILTQGVLDMIPEADDDAKFIFAGHSMGGAVSQIAALYGCAIQTPEQQSRGNTYVMTFGAPGGFSEDVVEKYNAIFPGSSFMRVEMKGDPVPGAGAPNQAGERFEIDGGFEFDPAAQFIAGVCGGTSSPDSAFINAKLTAHSVSNYVSIFPTIL